MIRDTLAQIQLETKLEFTSNMAHRHHFVQLRDGRWTRTYGPPDAKQCRQVKGRIWRMDR